jgi:hypothetical protein
MPRNRTIFCMILSVVSALAGSMTLAATVVPNEVQQPGTQPGEVGTLETPDKCDNCHGNYNRAVEPAFNWRGSMMANAGRDPIFWATLAIAEQDFDGAGDLCIRCHSTAGWQAGRSTPTDGSGLTAGDADGVECEACHKSTNPDDSEHQGSQSAPFVANDKLVPPQGYFGSGMLSLYPGSAKLGPYADADARHQFLPSQFHRRVEFCGSCHDVSNPVVGDLAPGAGKQPGGDPVVQSRTLGSAVSTKAAFNNFPFRYGVVERTWSEFMSGALSRTRVSNYASLPVDLKAGAIKAAFDSAGGDYRDGTARYFSCQTCHMRAVTGQGCNKVGVATRTDLPLHDMTGGNAWAADAIRHQNGAGTLRLGGGLTSVQLDALAAGKVRAQQQLRLAASLRVNGNVVRVTNLTGHKLISGYPEGRRMWINVRWYDASNRLLREDGAYGPIAVTIDGAPRTVNSLVRLDDPNTKVYQAHYGMTQEWANQLLDLGYPPDLVLAYDRVTGAVDYRLWELAAQPLGTSHETFHFVLNDTVIDDNRIPPFGFAYDEARRRNALPVPAAQYGSPTAGGSYQHYDDVALNPPSGATYADVRLMYQSTSWEYVQFLKLANNKTNAFLAAEGDNLLATWQATGMAEPYVMASASWGTPPAPSCTAPVAPNSLTASAAKRAITLKWLAGTPGPNGGYRIYYNQSGKLVYRAGVGPSVLTYKDGGLSSRVAYTYVVTAWADCNGNGTFDLDLDLESAPSNTVTATAQ